MFHPVSTNLSFNELTREEILCNNQSKINHYWSIFETHLGEETVKNIRLQEQYYSAADLQEMRILDSSPG